jgi:phosphoenolpyruvate carboxykinase (ATP)
MNISITTKPTGRSPENKWYFGSRAEALDLSRPKYNRIGNEEDFWDLHWKVYELDYPHVLVFYTCGICFRVHTNDDRHAQFVRNMFTVEDDPWAHSSDWEIYHNTDYKIDTPKIYIHLNEKRAIIVGTTFLGEIKKSVFGILSFELPEHKVLPMHCSAFTYENSTNLMFGLSGTGKTTLSSDPDYKLIGDDEIAWNYEGVNMIETGCYAKSEGLSPETHPTIFDAVERARSNNCLVEENPGEANARLSYPLSFVENSWEMKDLDHPNNIFFLTMDAKGVFPPISKISGDTVRRFFETGYTSQMPGTEKGVNEIRPLFSPCYGSPFMPRDVDVYSDMLMHKINTHKVNVYLVNTGMDKDGVRYPLEFTRQCVKDAIVTGREDNSEAVLSTLETLIERK